MNWDDTWMQIAYTMAKRSRCVRRQLGAVIVDSTNRVVATGYNGPPAGYPYPCAAACPRALYGGDDADYKNCISIHAEANALLFCDRREREGGTIYVPEMPCYSCAKLIANSGLKHVVVDTLEDQEHRPVNESAGLLKMAGLSVTVL